MTEIELLGLWAKTRSQIIASQLAPTLLLAATIWLVLEGLGAQPAPIKVATALVLLSGGILGALVQISAAREAQAIAADLAELASRGPLRAVSHRIIASATWTAVVRVVTPVIFTLTYLALLWAIFAPPAAGGMTPAP
jgi:hypothetical protein